MDLSRVVARVCLVVAVFGAGTAAARDRDEAIALALGDSVVFGYITQDGYAYVNPSNFVGYPERLSLMLDLQVVNAACPGEATTGFVSTTGADNGCRAFKANFPLHVSYGGAATQLAFATAQLKTHRHEVRLVTIGIGANDAFILECVFQRS